MVTASVFFRSVWSGGVSSGLRLPAERCRSAALSWRCCSKASTGVDRTAHGDRRWRYEPDLLLGQLHNRGILPGTMRAPLPDLDALDIEALKALILSQHEEKQRELEELTGREPHWTSSGLSIRPSCWNELNRSNA